jgi:hypothetical protein
MLSPSRSPGTTRDRTNISRRCGDLTANMCRHSSELHFRRRSHPVITVACDTLYSYPREVSSSSAIPSVVSTARTACLLSARSRPGKPSVVYSKESTMRQHRTNMPKVQNYGSQQSICCSMAGLRTSIRGRFSGPTKSCAGIPNGGFNAGGHDEADKQAPDIANIRTSISTRPSAFMPYRSGAPTCRARRFDDAGES